MCQSQDYHPSTLGCPSPSPGVYTYQMVKTAAHLVAGESSRSGTRMSLRASRGHTLEVHHPKGLLGQQSPRVWVDALPSTSREETEVNRNLLPGAGVRGRGAIAKCIQEDVCQHLEDSVTLMLDVSISFQPLRS